MFVITACVVKNNHNKSRQQRFRQQHSNDDDKEHATDEYTLREIQHKQCLDDNEKTHRQLSASSFLEDSS